MHDIFSVINSFPQDRSQVKISYSSFSPSCNWNDQRIPQKVLQKEFSELAKVLNPWSTTAEGDEYFSNSRSHGGKFLFLSFKNLSTPLNILQTVIAIGWDCKEWSHWIPTLHWTRIYSDYSASTVNSTCFTIAVIEIGSLLFYYMVYVVKSKFLLAL